MADRTVVDASERWMQAIRENSWLFLAVVALLISALIATILSPDLPPLASGLP